MNISVLLFSLLLSFSSIADHELQTVNFVEVERYLGKWYEIEKFPNNFQRNCEATQANYSQMDNGRLRVINKCKKSNGKIKTAKGSASIEDTNTNAKLKVSFFFLQRWIGKANYYIMALGSDYEYVLIGSPDRNFAWILSRTTTLDQKIIDQLKLTAQSQGFEIERFKKTPTWID